ncbi:MAG: tetratricopeptide repeat protein [Bryobacteraceae bacterium]|nr:tetratricopeptide repeat protein [Bryobacteraceae bacterium]
MKRQSIVVAALSLGVLALIGTGCQKLKARDHLNKGVSSFKNGKYQDAIDHFQAAVQLDPSYPTARLYLATAYMNQYIPGAQSEENLRMSKAAMENFLKVLEQEPNNTVALASLASLHYSEAQGIVDLDAKLRKLDEAKEWYQKLASADPQNKEAYYSLGVIVWAKWYPALMAERAKLGMKPEEPGPLKDKKVRDELKAKYGTLIEEGIRNLEKALEIDQEYDDAMAYLNLLIRERADLADSPEQYKKEVEIADNWVSKALETKKIKAARAANAPAGAR